MSSAQPSMDQRVITAIETQKQRRNRCSIFIDGEFALGVEADVVGDLRLHVGQRVSDADLERISRADLVVRAKRKALNLLEYRHRSRAEIVGRLRQGGFDDDVIGQVVTFLERLGLLNDEEFARNWVRYRQSGKACGRARIRWELRRKGVSNDIIERSLSEISGETEYALAMDVARRRWEKCSVADSRLKRQRVASYLRRQGFDWEVVSEVLDKLASEDD